MIRSLVVLALAATANAACPNGCSGHGSCGNDDICTCYQDWLSPDTVKPNGGRGGGGGDCSQMKCPYEIAWVDTPSGPNKAHALAECAGRGLCDRSTGDCQCFDGYEGKGCRRTTCPNACSGHGTCEYLAELRNDVGDSFKYTGNRPTVDQYDYEFPLLWDAYKTRACVCDPKWTDVDCSRRMCPRGNYALYAHTEPKPEVQAIIIRDVYTPGTDRCSNQTSANFYKFRYGVGANGDNYPRGNNGVRRSNTGGQAEDSGDSCAWEDGNGEFALTFRSTLGEEFTTKTLNVYNLTEEEVAESLMSLPNKVIEDAEVTVFRNMTKAKWLHMWNNTHHNALGHNVKDGHIFPYSAESNYTWYSNDLVILVSFSGAMTTGDQFELECKTAYCGAGCQPKLENPLDFKYGGSDVDACKVINNFQMSYGLNLECSGRGSCDYSNGVCECYQGYTDEYCSTQTALI